MGESALIGSTEPTSLVKATFDYFGASPSGLSKVTEFSALTKDDQRDLHAGLTEVGYNLRPLS